MEYIPLDTFDALAQNYFLPLESAILDDTISSKAILLRYYTSVMRRWGNLIRSASPQAARPLPDLVSRAEMLCLALLESPPGLGPELSEERSAGLSVLRFYGELSNLYSHSATNPDIRLTAPLPQTVYVLGFIPSLCSVSLLSTALASYKSSFEASVLARPTQGNASPRRRYPPAVVDQFNGYVMDMCNLLWRNRGLNRDDPNAKGCLITPQATEVFTEYLDELSDFIDRGDDDGGKYRFLLASLFSFGHHIALCGFAAACFRDIEAQVEAEGKTLSARLGRPVTQKALTALEKDGGVKISWQEFRVRMLDWLDERGAEGIGALMRVTMKTLRKA